MFYKFNLNYKENIFSLLSASTNLEHITAGRKGANIADCKDDLIPIIRTTTSYNNPTQKFQPIHYDIINDIKNKSKISELQANNAMIEIYESQYRKMKFHSDQSLDLAENSYICIFSCYNTGVGDRRLVTQDKETKKLADVLLDHNSAMIFSTNTNKNHVHKIVLGSTYDKSNKWLGITFRLSKTFIRYVEGVPCFYSNDKILRLATEEERKDLAKHKRSENEKIEYKYPDIEYTISIGDILPIE